MNTFKVNIFCKKSTIHKLKIHFLGETESLTLSWRGSLSHRNRFIDLLWSCSANQWTGFYMTETSVVNELNISKILNDLTGFDDSTCLTGLSTSLLLEMNWSISQNLYWCYKILVSLTFCWHQLSNYHQQKVFTWLIFLWYAALR